MMEIYQELERFREKRWLVHVHRTSIEHGGIQGYILSVSPVLVLLRYVRDFQPDGFLVLRVEDITSVRATKTDRLQHRIMDEAGLLAETVWDQAWDLAEWRACLGALATRYRAVIVEEEAFEKPGFTIGPICRVEEARLVMHHFSGAGRWDEELVELDWSDITCCQFDSRYIRMYEEYFDRHGLWPDG